MANKTQVAGGGGDKLLGRGQHDSRLAIAHDTCADSSCLDGKDGKSLRFVVLVFLGRDGCKAATQPTAGRLMSVQLWHLMYWLEF